MIMITANVHSLSSLFNTILQYDIAMNEQPMSAEYDKAGMKKIGVYIGKRQIIGFL